MVELVVIYDDLTKTKIDSDEFDTLEDGILIIWAFYNGKWSKYQNYSAYGCEDGKIIGVDLLNSTKTLEDYVIPKASIKFGKYVSDEVFRKASELRPWQ